MSPRDIYEAAVADARAAYYAATGAYPEDDEWAVPLPVAKKPAKAKASKPGADYYAGGFRVMRGGVPCKVWMKRVAIGEYVRAKDWRP